MRNALASTLAVMLAPLVVLAVLVGLVSMGTEARAEGAEPEGPDGSGQQWGFVDAPAAVTAGWRGPLTVAWRNASEQTRTFDVRVVGSELESGDYAWSSTVVAEPGESFRRELALPALASAGEYHAELLLDGEVLAAADVSARRALVDTAVRVVDVRTSAARIAPEARQRARRSVVTTFGVSRSARVTAQVRDAAGHVVARRALGETEAGRTVRWAWHGRRTSGRVVEAGTYTLHLQARAGTASGSHEVQVRVQR